MGKLERYRTQLLFLQHFAHFVEQTIPAVAISQIQSNG